MSNQRFMAIVLAAGKSTRFKSNYPKALHLLSGLPIGEYVLRAVLDAGPEQTYMVVGHRAEEVRKAFERPRVQFIEQEEQLGTGHALMAARHELERSPSPAVMVVVADAPLIRSETLRELAATHARTKAAATVLTTRLDNPNGYGRVVRGKGPQIRAIVEEKLCTPTQKNIREINCGILCFDRRKLLQHLGRLTRDNGQEEYLLTDLIAMLRGHGEKVLAFPVEDFQQVLGINDRKELAAVEKILRLKKAESLMRDGVTILNLEATYIDGDVRVGVDTILEPGVGLLGRSVVGSNCTIRVGSVIADSTLGDGVVVRPYSIITGCAIGSNVIIGPFAHLRDGAVIEMDARIGNFVEVKKSRIGKRTKAWHLTYLGDAVLGEDVNVGAGTVTCNYDGRNKHTATVEDHVFIGSGTMIVAPVKIGRGAYVAAGSTITEDVPPESLALARARQVNKEGWARQHNEELKSSMPSFTLTEREAGPITILDLSGPLVIGAPVEQFRQGIRNLLGSGRRRALVNMSDVAYVDSAGLGALVGALTAFRKASGAFKLACVPIRVLAIMETAHLERAFEILPDEPSALRSFHPQTDL
jgi:bifunctional UDP-N-acetylglucosamine pyrophosphorylase/glucosamine-1-phosphate N-acetyltransferase